MKQFRQPKKVALTANADGVIRVFEADPKHATFMTEVNRGLMAATRVYITSNHIVFTRFRFNPPVDMPLLGRRVPQPVWLRRGPKDASREDWYGFTFRKRDEPSFWMCKNGFEPITGLRLDKGEIVKVRVALENLR